MAKVALALVHHPVFDRAGKTVATNVTNFDIHDIARAACVYNLDNYFIVHPMKEQLMFVSRVLDHWRTGEGTKHNPMRRTALDPVRVVESITQAKEEWSQKLGGKKVKVIATSAREVEGLPNYTFREFRAQIEDDEPCLILFGTGFGLTQEALDLCDGVIEPIRGVGERDYRHLSVRSAVSICLDRLLGSW